MSASRSFVCITCPRGCLLAVDIGADRSVTAVRGNACKRGEDYARAEVVDPRRSLTSTVRVEGGVMKRLPVRSSAALPLHRLREAARALDAVVARPPLTCGSIVMADILGLGIDIVATDSLERS